MAASTFPAWVAFPSKVSSFVCFPKPPIQGLNPHTKHMLYYWAKVLTPCWSNRNAGQTSCMWVTRCSVTSCNGTISFLTTVAVGSTQCPSSTLMLSWRSVMVSCWSALFLGPWQNPSSLRARLHPRPNDWAFTMPLFAWNNLIRAHTQFCNTPPAFCVAAFRQTRSTRTAHPSRSSEKESGIGSLRNQLFLPRRQRCPGRTLNSCNSGSKAVHGSFSPCKGGKKKIPFWKKKAKEKNEKKSGLYGDLSKTEKILKRLREGQRWRQGGNCLDCQQGTSAIIWSELC